MRAWLLALVFTGCGGQRTDVAARTCGTCHATQFTAWNTSAHARSGTSPVFDALLPRVERAWGTTARTQCLSCHQPGPEVAGGIGCATCHLAVGNRGESNGALVVDLEAPLASPGLPSERAPHTVARRAFLTSASLCGTCHEVRTPHLEEPTLSEYRTSPAADEDSCASCHFREGHRVAGLSPRWDGSEEERARTLEATRQLVAEALRLEVVGDEVRLTNVGAAHAVPTGMISLRDLWVDVTVFETDGSTTLATRVIELGGVPERDGVSVPLVTDATHVRSRSLAPGEVRTWKRDGARLEARLYARGVRQEVLQALELPLVAPTLTIQAARGP
ncbi:MAG: hypothetical protein JNM17_19170 [Archangium sp.]|nr:hypothetical protein [Archangium sp.]